MGDEPLEYLYKVLVVGEGNTGKTCIIRRYVHNIFQMSTKATIGVDFALKVLNWDRTKNITLQIWDIAGQERYGQMTRVYYQAAVGALVVYDVTRPESFDAVAKWKQDIDNKVFLSDGSKIPCVLLANKCDLPEVPERTKDELDSFCASHGFVGWFHTSSKENINIEKAYKFLVDKVLENDQRLDQGDNAVARDRVALGESNQIKKKCC
jgi:small GTP-binding protein|eukprot:CAMPEP_0174301286 /NCGR_PEP_ID=MMETSP0809-20121228/58963_1 /TAXON_ID=73025 ORGANISM="Eutreptiella gymnastica-like, Strain CCMP1594" /NCGR_SAMPLE_ID=MMETSP0809 /ASSEMBLY_ACC=CAM_ASM_000658 /LENGTH=208 /DNA_ID=CAMNT_0015407017 /DNA_START=23 /DNA_END=649 /DNA_ORIENTATION=+